MFDGQRQKKVAVSPSRPTNVIPTTIRDATYVLDEILDNETELAILEHTTDTAGYTDLVFGLFDLLGLQFSPRLADLADKKLYRIDKQIKYKNINSLIKGKINVDLILRHWDDLLRIAGSLSKMRWAIFNSARDTFIELIPKPAASGRALPPDRERRRFFRPANLIFRAIRQNASSSRLHWSVCRHREH